MNKKELEKYSVECIYLDDYGKDTSAMTDKEKIAALFGIFDDEYNSSWMKKNYPKFTDRLGQYFRGLPSCYNIDFDNYSISQLAKERFGVNERFVNSFIDSFFEHVANALVSAATKNDVYISKYL